jgi:mRNA interferase RelE/StbE
MFEVLVNELASRFLAKASPEIARQIKKKIIELKEFPEQRGKHLRYAQFWSLRVGDYRIIYEIRKSESKVLVLFIGHRSDVYDDFSKVY